MSRALELAGRGLYTTTPNPRVGCVIVQGGSVVGEGDAIPDVEPRGASGFMLRIDEVTMLIDAFGLWKVEPQWWRSFAYANESNWRVVALTASKPVLENPARGGVLARLGFTDATSNRVERDNCEGERACNPVVSRALASPSSNTRRSVLIVPLDTRNANCAERQIQFSAGRSM